MSNFLKLFPIEADESLAGYLLRLSDAATYENLSWITELGGHKAFSGRNLNSLAKYMSCVSELLPEKRARLEQHGYLPATGKSGPLIGFSNQQFDYNLIDTTRFRYCTKCLKASQFHRKIWDIGFYITCHTHQIELTERCPDCEEIISWQRKRLLKCTCGFKLINAAEISASPADIKLSAMIAGAIVSGCGLEDLYKQFSLIGWLAGSLICRGLNPMAPKPISNYKNLASLTAKVYFKDWPKNWDALLETYFKENNCPFDSRILKHPSYRNLRKQLSDPSHIDAYEKAKVGFEKFIQAKALPILQNPTDPMFTSQREAKHYLKVKDPMFKWLIQKGVIELENSKHKKQDCQKVLTHSLSKAKECLNNLIAPPAAARRLKLPQSTILTLLHKRALKATRGPLIDGYNFWLIHTNQIQSYQNKAD